MATNTQIVTGFIVRPNGDPFTQGIVRFALTGVDTDGNEVIARKKTADFVIAADGSIAVELWSNTRGTAGSFYTVQVREGDAGDFETVGRIQVPDAGPYDLATLMRADVPAAQKTFYSVLTQAEYDVFIDLMDAKLSDMDGKLVTGSGYVDAALNHKNEAAALAALTLGYKDDVASAIVYQDLAAIAAAIAGTAVDYAIDTSPNPSLAVQRQTSWFAGLGPLPETKVWVIEKNKITMLDGDDPSLPVWGDFFAGVPSYSGTNLTSIAAVNGVVVVGCTVYSGFLTLDFGSDLWRWEGDGQGGTGSGSWVGTIGNPLLSTGRVSSAATYGTTYTAGITIVSKVVNDVAMTVLPDAPVAPVSGLQVPTIAVGTDGGVSIIDGPAGVGTVVNITVSHASYTMSKNVEFDEKHALFLDLGNSNNTSYHQNYVFRTIPKESTSLTVNTKTGTAADADENYTSRTDAPSDVRLLVGGSNRHRAVGIVASGDDVCIAMTGNSGFNLVSPNPSVPSEGMVAHITSSYNTGWIADGCLGVLLCSTDTTSLIGSGELIANGSGDSTVGWLASTANVSVASVGGQLEVTNNGAGWIYQSFPTVIGQRYYVTNEFITKVGGGRIYIGTSVGNLSYHNNTGLAATNIPITFVATTTEAFISLGDSSGGVGVVNVYDNFSVKLADADRSVNNKGVIVNGIVPRTPVATGAEKVWHGPFSATDNVTQPYNPDLDFGTGDYSIRIRARLDVNSTQFIYSRNVSTPAKSALYFSSGRLRYQTNGADLLTAVDDTFGDGRGRVFTVTRKDGVTTLYVDDVLKAQDASDVSDLTLEGPLYVGHNGGVSPLTNGRVSDLQTYDRALSHAEIKFMNKQELPMFQEDAACTLYGTSDAVTALAHDSVTDLLHVGTSAGRSDFSDLIRVGNTTTPVTTAIAARDGLILEQ